MRSKRLPIGLRVALETFAVVFFVTSTWAAPHEKVLHSFQDNFKDGFYPWNGLVIDAAGNLYGTTISGGAYDYGTVYELTPEPSGGWKEEVLYSFNGLDGVAEPNLGLVLDAVGNLYGMTGGGALNGGAVFELTPKPGGGWTETVLFNFDGKEGSSPTSLMIDAAGNLYGTTYGGGAYGGGTVFELTPKKGGGEWTETVLVNFGEYKKDGWNPDLGLVLDAAGNLYGTTQGGGAHGYGTVYELTPEPSGGWKEKVLYNFNPISDGYETGSQLVLDTVGNLYGMTIEGGAYVGGTVYELTPKASGGWKKKVLHEFNPKIGDDGWGPFGGVIFDAAGNLYGMTAAGGRGTACGGGCGTVFELTPKPGGGWKEKVLHAFNYKDGAGPLDGLIFDATGNLYGTTTDGGAHRCFGEGQGCGTVFEVTP